MDSPLIPFDIFTSPKNARVRIENAWENFVSGKDLDTDVRNSTRQSWERSCKHGIHPVQGKAPIILTPDNIREYHSTSALNPTLEVLFSVLKEVAIDSGHLIVFCNNQGEIVYIDGHPSLVSKAERMNFVIGSSWSERYIGTNAIGTSLATGKPLQIFASEHFCQPVHDWVCSASPVRDPATNNIIGIIDLTGPWNMIHPHSLSSVVSIAYYIEEKLSNQLEKQRAKLVEHFKESSNKEPNKIVAVLDRGGRVLMAHREFYEKNLIDKNQRLVDLDHLSIPLTSTMRWESNKDTSRPAKLTFELTPFKHLGIPIGAEVHLITPINIAKRKENSSKYTFSNMIGQSKELQSVIEEASTMAKLEMPVLIEGESGTGKELFAQSIHSLSNRSSGPFIAVNCGAIQKELAASELFGYEEGTFTGAIKGGRSGKFQQAEGGTIFLDEIGEMPLDLQTNLLRILEEGEVVRLGGKRPIKLNVRVIAASNCDLRKLSSEGKFRADLYYRLNVLSLSVPPLRNRTGDIPLILNYFLRMVCIDVKRSEILIDNEALQVLNRYKWPGNVREIRNFTYKMAVKKQDNLITIADLPSEVLGIEAPKYPPVTLTGDNTEFRNSGHSGIYPTESNAGYDKSSLKDQELQIIYKVLDELNGNVKETAKRLGIHRSTIYRKIGKL
ncbi:sigma-54-dependent Fis family transcriptional regulator [Salipaludibacillus sp. CF4.18]|uniref:sigma-54-dependent Fis family transcriptional regulator n=1 Tax=Salipaludibacillus sp. CF4.18 TaxID=3373081 RepID=UPI003EE7F024